MVRWLLVTAFLLGGAVLLVTTPVRAGEPLFAALDVGQGDSLIVDGGIGVMIDTGNPGSQALDKARAIGSEVKALIITHLHQDHAGDAERAISANLAAVLWNGNVEGSTYEKLVAATKRAGVPLVALIPGDVLHAGSARMQILGPQRGYRTSSDENDASLVIRADLPGLSALLMGDAPLEAEAGLRVGRVDVLKVGHHGSKGSTGEALLDATQPQTAIISAGKGNRYGHPAPELLHRLDMHDISVRRTDEEGTIVLRP